MKVENINNFLNYIHGKHNGIIKVYKYINTINRKSMVQIKSKDIINENKYGDIYFIPNLGGDKNEAINIFNAVFIDLDAGRDENKNYFPLEQVKEYKNTKIKEIDEFPLKPTFIIETRNGLHVYWILNNNPNLEDWKLCIDKLIVKFNSDKQACNPARLMRMPFTYWMKDENNPFEVKIIEFNDIRYEINKILENLYDIESVPEKSDKRVDNILNKSFKKDNSFNIISTLSSKIEDDDYNIKAIRNRDVEYLKNKINNIPIEFENDAEFWYYIFHNINMAELLELNYPKSFKCIFHDDNNPSASVYQKNDVWLYTCHSECNMTLNIQQLIEKLGNFKSEYRAIKFIKDIYNLSIKETEWSIEQKSNLESILYKLDMDIFSELCPQTNKNIRYVKELFIKMVRLAKDNVYGENYANSDGDVVFFVSLSELARRMKVSLSHKNRISQRLAVLIYHDLIRKLDDDKIPEAMLKRSQAISINKQHSKRINFYAIPSWIFEHLKNVEIQGYKWKDNGYTVKGTSYEMFYRSEGLEVAQKIYPQHKKIKEEKIDFETGEITETVKDRTISKISNNKVLKIIDSINKLIDKKGYVTEEEIVIYLSKEFLWDITRIQLRKIRGQFEDLGFKRIRANNQIKEQYGVISDGYPFIIVKK